MLNTKVEAVKASKKMAAILGKDWKITPYKDLWWYAEVTSLDEYCRVRHYHVGTASFTAQFGDYYASGRTPKSAVRNVCKDMQEEFARQTELQKVVVALARKMK